MAGTLGRDSIVAACVALIESEGIGALTMRRLGAALGVDATAVYRHFRDKDDLLRAVGDHAHALVLTGGPAAHDRAPSSSGASSSDVSGEWRAVVRELCIRLRAAQLARPALAALVRAGPPLHDHEFELTETLLAQLHRGGLSGEAGAFAYHALIELVVGSAAIDAPMAATAPDDREAAYASWRRAYAVLDARRYPTAVATAAQLYPSSADGRFAYALDRMLDGIAGLQSGAVSASDR